MGGTSETELRERRDRVEDALNATRAAVEEGIVVGRGVALVRAGRILDDPTGENPDENASITLVRKALGAPLIRSAENAGFDGTFVIGKVREAETDSFGFDAARSDCGVMGSLRIQASFCVSGAISVLACRSEHAAPAMTSPGYWQRMEAAGPLQLT